MDRYTLMHRVLSGTATDAERDELHQWISSDPLNAGAFEEMMILYSNDDLTGPDEEHFEGLRKLQESIRQLKQEKKRQRWYNNIGVSILISAVVFIVSIYLFNLDTPRQRTDNVADIVLSNDLQFNNATLGSILELLEDQYHLAFTTNTRDLLSCTFTGTFYHGISLADLIRTLAQAENLKIIFVDEKKMEISGRGCP